MIVSANFAQGVDTSRLSAGVYAAMAKKLKLKVSRIRALVHVEAGKSGFWADGNMKLLYEGHIAYRETSGTERAKLVKAGLAWRSWGDVKYGKATTSRDRLRRALQISGAKAFRWASYGLPQIMGFNAEMLSYDDAKVMFDTFLQGEAEQLDGMMRFITVRKLLVPLRNGNWPVVAEGYNGPGYRKNQYDTRLAQADAMFSKADAPVDAWADGVLRIGDSGPVIEALQEQLNRLFEMELEIDGDYGRATAQAVQHAQKMMGVSVDGIVGKGTQAALDAYVKPQPKQVEEGLRDSGSRTIEAADDVKTSWFERMWALVTTGGLGGLSFIGNLNPWLIGFVVALAFAGFIFWQIRKDKAAKAIIAARVDDAMTGKNFGRVV